MPTHHKSLDVSLVLDHIQCIDEGDGPGLAEPYLWTLFFKIDGTSVQPVKLPNPPLMLTRLLPSQIGNRPTNQQNTISD